MLQTTCKYHCRGPLSICIDYGAKLTMWKDIQKRFQKQLGLFQLSRIFSSKIRLPSVGFFFGKNNTCVVLKSPVAFVG